MRISPSEDSVKVQKVRSKNSVSFYIAKSFRNSKTGKYSSKVVEKLGTLKELQEKLGPDINVDEWAKQRARELTIADDDASKKIQITYSPTKKIENDANMIANFGYIFLEKVYCELGINSITSHLKEKYNVDFDLDFVFSRLLFESILNPSSSGKTQFFAKTLIRYDEFSDEEISRTLQILADELDYIQRELYERSSMVIDRDTSVLFHNCTNYLFDFPTVINQEHPESALSLQPLVQVDLFVDASGVPLAIYPEPNDSNSHKETLELELKILQDFKLSHFIRCSDLNVIQNSPRRLNTHFKASYINTQPVNDLPTELKEWALDKSGWSLVGDDSSYDISEVDDIIGSDSFDQSLRNKLRMGTYYKTNTVLQTNKESGTHVSRCIISVYSPRYKKASQRRRQELLNQILSEIGGFSQNPQSNNFGKASNYIERLEYTLEGETFPRAKFKVDYNALSQEARGDGFYIINTDFQMQNIESIINSTNSKRKIEKCFHIMKSEIKHPNFSLSSIDRIRSHFVISFVSLLVYRTFQLKIGDGFTSDQIIEALSSMRMIRIKNQGWQPIFTPTPIINTIQKKFEIDTDMEILSEKDLGKILTKIRRV